MIEARSPNISEMSTEQLAWQWMNFIKADDCSHRVTRRGITECAVVARFGFPNLGDRIGCRLALMFTEHRNSHL